MKHASLENIQHGTAEMNIAFYNHIYPYTGNMLHGEFAAHWHAEYEIIYVFQGSVIVSMNDKSQCIKSGQALFINKNVIHASVSPSTQKLHYVCVTFGEQFLFSNTLDVLYKEYFFPLHIESKQIPSYISGDCQWQKEMLDVIQKLCTSGLKKARGCELEWRILLLQFFHIAYTNDVFLTKTEENETNISAIQSALLSIQKNYADSIQISQLAKQAGFSTEHFCRVFKSITGKTPNEYLLSCRMQQAEYLLSHTAQSISDIALSCGFNDINYFSRYFKKMHHITPREYRNSIR